VAQKKRKKRLSEEWIAPAEMKARLGLSDNTLRKLRDDGVLVNGKHWLDINPYSTPRYRYHYENCKTTLIELRRKSDSIG